jgi:hypothetical protein
MPVDKDKIINDRLVINNAELAVVFSKMHWRNNHHLAYNDFRVTNF